MSFAANISVEKRSLNGLFLDPSLDLSGAWNCSYQRIRNAVGSGSFTLETRDEANNDLPDGTAVGFRIDGVLRFVGRIEGRTTTNVSETDEDAESVTLDVIEIVGDLAAEPVLPLLGYAMLVPPTDERMFSVFADSYDDTDYPAYATNLGFQGWETPYWTGEPEGWSDPTAAHVWSSSIGLTAREDAPNMICIFRATILVEGGKKALEWACDDYGTLFVNGREVQESIAMRSKATYEFETGAGILILAWEVTNAPAAVPGQNPASLIASLRQGSPEGTVIWNTATTARGALSPGNASVPRMNVDTRGPEDPRPGHRIGGIIEMIKGRLPDSWTNVSDYLVDDGGGAWPSTDAISWRIFEDSLWDCFANLMEIWVDMLIDVSSGAIATYNKGNLGDPVPVDLVVGYSPAGVADPDAVNVTELSWELIRPKFDKVAVRWKEGWAVFPLEEFETHERIKAVRMEQVETAGLALEFAEALHALYAEALNTATLTYWPQSPGDVPHVAFDVHDIWEVPFMLPDETVWLIEQVILSITAEGDEDGDVKWIVELGSPVEDAIKWMERAIARGFGTMGGQARGANGQILGDWGIGVPRRRSAGHSAHVIASAPGAVAGRTSTAPNQFVGKVVTLRLIGQTGTGASTVTVTSPGGAKVLSGSGEGLLDVVAVDETWATTTDITVDLDTVNHADLHVYADVSDVW